MKQEIARRWVEALRSGKYQQTSGTLARKDPVTGTVGYCCLGVLCEIAVEDQVIPPKFEADGLLGETGRYVFGNDTAIPSTEVMTWAGETEAWTVSVPDEIEKRLNDADSGAVYGRAGLPSLNDDAGLTFPEIADLIEAEYLS